MLLEGRVDIKQGNPKMCVKKGGIFRVCFLSWISPSWKNHILISRHIDADISRT